jgi:hypothetical protein
VRAPLGIPAALEIAPYEATFPRGIAEIAATIALDTSVISF